MLLRILIIFLSFLLTKPSKLPRVNFFKITLKGEFVMQDTSSMRYTLDSIIYNYNITNKHFDLIKGFNCYLLPDKNIDKYLKLIYKEEKIRDPENIFKKNSSNVLFSENSEFLYIRKSKGKYSVKYDCIYISQDSSYIGVVKLKNLHDY
jgi:hypothetical protein